MKKYLVIAGLLSVISFTHAELSFNFNFTDTAGVGFNADGQVGIDRRTALANAANHLGSYFTNYTATIDIDVDGSVTGDFLASAGSNYHASYPGTGFNDRGDVMIKILGGADPAPGVADGVVNWNFADYDWALGDVVGSGQYDFISTAMHELTHAVGFAASIGQYGSDAWGTPAGQAGVWTPMDQWVSDSLGAIIDSSTYILDSNRWSAASVSEYGLYFIGTNAMLAYGGDPVPLYCPSEWEGGSSGGSHLNDYVFVDPDNKLMNAMAAPAGTLDIRELSAIELGVLQDIGYTEIIPEPCSLILLGLGGLALRYRKR